MNKILSEMKKRGLKGLIRYSIHKALGIELYDERINTLNYFLNNYCNVRDFPEADGELRLVQKGDILLLAITDKICKLHGLDYWLDAGTCLGAVRHSGFIPWDDDVDICMMREEYEKAREVLRDELGKYGIDAIEEKNEPIARIGIGYHHYETGLWIDLFPAEYTTIDPNNIDAVMHYKRAYKKYQRKWKAKKNRLSREETFELRKKYIPEICAKQAANSIIYCPEFGAVPRIWGVEEILPVCGIEFENCELLAPANTHSYLIQFYGDNYMGFPQTGIAHHGNDSQGKLTSWAMKSGTDMKEVIKYLESVLNSIDI